MIEFFILGTYYFGKFFVIYLALDALISVGFFFAKRDRHLNLEDAFLASFYVSLVILSHLNVFVQVGIFITALVVTDVLRAKANEWQRS